MNSSEIDQLIHGRAQESLYLEFKRGDALSRQNNSRSELIKDVTGFANAAGGRLIYGIAESLVGGISAAESLAPVTAPDLDKDWLSSVIRDNTSPRLLDFDVQEISVQGGRVLVVEVRPASTAHQNLFDLRYYQRAGVTTAPINDFQIRDLMARRTRPLAEVAPTFVRMTLEDLLHRYALGISIRNIGVVTLEKWWFEIDIPIRVLVDRRRVHRNQMRDHALFDLMVRTAIREDGSECARIGFGDPFLNGNRYILHPDQSCGFSMANASFPQFILEVDDEIYRGLGSTPLSWTMYLNDSPPLRGEVPFDEWCTF